MKKRLFIIIAIIISVTVLFTACGSSGGIGNKNQSTQATATSVDINKIATDAIAKIKTATSEKLATDIAKLATDEINKINSYDAKMLAIDVEAARDNRINELKIQSNPSPTPTPTPTSEVATPTPTPVCECSPTPTPTAPATSETNIKKVFLNKEEIMKFQKQIGVKVDGIWGGETQKAWEDYQKKIKASDVTPTPTPKVEWKKGHLEEFTSGKGHLVVYEKYVNGEIVIPKVIKQYISVEYILLPGETISSATPTPTPTPSTVDITGGSFPAGTVKIPVGKSINTGQINNLFGVKYQNRTGVIIYVVNKTNSEIELNTVGGCVLETTDVSILVQQERNNTDWRIVVLEITGTNTVTRSEYAP